MHGETRPGRDKESSTSLWEREQWQGIGGWAFTRPLLRLVIPGAQGSPGHSHTQQPPLRLGKSEEATPRAPKGLRLSLETSAKTPVWASGASQDTDLSFSTWGPEAGPADAGHQNPHTDLPPTTSTHSRSARKATHWTKAEGRPSGVLGRVRWGTFKSASHGQPP